MISKKLLMLPVVIALLAFTTGASAQTVGAPRLGVQLLSNGLTQNPTPGMSNVTYAVLRLDTTYSSDDIRLNSLPIIVTASGGANPANLNNCAVYNAASNTALSTGSNVSAGLVGGVNNINFNAPLVLPRGTVTTLNVQCNLDPAAAVGGTFQFSLNTANVSAVGNTTGIPAIVSVDTGAPVVIPPTTGGGIGLPNTGAGGQASANIALLLASVAAISFGTLYVRKAAR